MPSFLLILALFFYAADRPVETIYRYGGTGHDWHLTEMNGTEYDGSATITFPGATQVAGQGPCNRFHTQNTLPYPWFKAGPIGSTRMACPDLATEAAFLKALEAADMAIVEGDTLTLSTEGGETLLIFKADD